MGCCLCKCKKSKRNPGSPQGQSTEKDARPINLNYQSPYRSTTTKTIMPPSRSTVQLSSGSRKSAKFVVTKTRRFYDQDTLIPTYSTHSRTRGEVLIINNILFGDNLRRTGAAKDHENLKSVFQQMGFKVTILLDKTKDAMEREVKNFSRKSSLKSADIAIVVVMSHGTQNQVITRTEIFGVDERGILVDHLIEPFSEQSCRNMLGKPKIFICQCCRGNDEEFRVVDHDARPIKPPKPIINDTLVAYSSLPGFVSHRDTAEGTWYIGALCEVFSEYAHEYHVEDLLKMVNRNLTDAELRPTPQNTFYENRGFKRCFLHPI